MSKNEHGHLFISYASEDEVFASWLARRLAADGYAVWFAPLKLLGGESWPPSIQAALEKSGRFLALMSEYSTEKEMPKKERTMAMNLGQERKVDDFIIPLRLDDSPWDWTLGDLAEISFQSSWMEGWRRLLKKLQSIGFPKNLSNGAEAAIESLATASVVLSEPETLRLNVFEVEKVPNVLKLFRINSLSREQEMQLRKQWPHYWINKGRGGIAFVEPPCEFREFVTQSSAQCLWRDNAKFEGIPVTSIVPALVRASLWTRLFSAGCLGHPNPRKRSAFYLPGDYRGEERLSYQDVDGKSRKLKIRRYKTLRKVSGNEKIYFHFAFQVDLARGVGEGFSFQIVPALMFFGEDGRAVVDERVNPLRKKVTKGWYNEAWQKWFLAAEQLILSTQEQSSDGLVIAEAGISLNSPCSLDESQFAKGIESDDLETEDAGEIIEEATEMEEVKS